MKTDLGLQASGFNHTLIHQLIEPAFYAHPERIAVMFNQTGTTYQELADRSNNLANALLFETSDEIIGISTARSIEMVIGVLAILKAGKAYLPLDPTYPAQRLEQIIADSGISYCVALAKEKTLFATLNLHVIAADQKYDCPTQSAAYQNGNACVLYTSGSNGIPKGVKLGHEGFVNLIKYQKLYSCAKPGMRSLQFCHLSFDGSFPEIFVPLATGGTIYIIDDAYRLDSGKLLEFIFENEINRAFLPFVALQYLAEAAVAEERFPENLFEIITGGELLKITPQISAFFAALPECTLVNAYGPTEASVWVTELRLKGSTENWPSIPTIGKTIDNVEIFFLDDELNLVENGETGELCISGICLANGYLKRPELTAEKFTNWTHPEKGEIKIYRTGDLGKYRADGEIEFFGRSDNQVKIRGNRVELGEIEVALNQQKNVKQSVVAAREDIPGQKILVAYLVTDAQNFDLNALRATIKVALPEYMIPAHFVLIDDIPKMVSGKVDKKALPKPEIKRPELSVLYIKPKTILEKNLAAVWIELLQLDKVGLEDNFFELGGNSLLAQKTVAILKHRFNYLVPVTKIYQFPTLSGIVGFLEQKARPDVHPKSAKKKSESSDIAIIGMAGRFPGADTISGLWNVLKSGKETTRFFSNDELDESIPAEVKNDPMYVKARGVINGADHFDAAFFGLNPKQADAMDPQQRLFMEIAWEVLEQNGHIPQKYDGSIGVFAGCGTNTYYYNNVLNNPLVLNTVGAFQATTLNEKDFIASRTAYQLNLKGPAVSLFSACSTSLLAIAQATDSIRNGQCDVAIAGGASVTAPINSGYLYEEGAMLSKDGHCNTFNANSTGTVFSDGAGVVLLKSLEAAKSDGDVIYAVIKGCGVNNDGGSKGSFTAPNSEGQAGAITMALHDAGVEPSTISYVEAHGTATPLGDPVEIEGLKIAFGEQAEKQFCAIGSIKSNMGHLTAAAGVAGLIKTTLALYHKQIPASINYIQPNPNIDFANSPFYVNDKLNTWESETSRRAGVSSFGVGGTNVHVILEEFENTAGKSGNGRPFELVSLSAKTENSRDLYARNLVGYLQEHAGANLADIAFTLQTSRADFNHRRFMVVSNNKELAEKLEADAAASESKIVKDAPGEVVFMFPGQGSQYLNMGLELYQNEPGYRNAVDECAEILQSFLDADIREIMYPETDSAAAEARLKNTKYTQPALFVTEYALAKLWMSWGVNPSICCGHSIGEFVAAHLSGVFTLADALKLIATRGKMVSELPEGSMLSVRMEAETLVKILPPTLSISAINTSISIVVAGSVSEITTFAKQLDEQEIPNRTLLTSHAFHSAMMDPIVGDFEEVVKQVSLNRPKKAIVSTVTGSWLTDAQATDPAYWAGHLRATVRFADAMDFILTQDNPLLLEVGPGSVTASLARQQSGSKNLTKPFGAILSSLDNKKGVQSEYQSLLKSLGQLWLNGITIDWQAYYKEQNRSQVMLPAYAFDKRICWIKPAPVHVSHPVTITQPLAAEQAVEDAQLRTMRKDLLIEKVKEILENASGIEMDGVSPDTAFLEVGLDSLLLTQVSLALKKEFGLPLTFRQLNEDYATFELLAGYLDANLPAELYQPAVAPQAAAPQFASQPEMAQPASPPQSYGSPVELSGNDTSLGLIAQQLSILAKQVALMQGGNQLLSAITPIAQSNGNKQVPADRSSVKPATLAASELTPEDTELIKKPFGAIAKIEKHATELSEVQKAFIQQFTERYNKKTKGSKDYTQENRAQMADPRVVSGFKPYTKEIVYPIVINKSKGSKLWDLDGNEYIDMLNGFGSTIFGYQPDFMKRALHDQVENGYEIGPQHEMAGEVSKLVCGFTGFDRAALCSTGSEAVLGTMRIARTVTGRSLIVAFTGSYHGIVDEVLIRGTKKLKSFPAAPGIMPESVQNMLILDYGTEESLRIIKERAHELAAVLVETVQSRRPEFVPVSFLKQLREITAESGTALIFDEVITGFRMHPGGAQALFNIKADLASYGKVVGGGLPIGVIAGKKEFMDALDGGFWKFGDASIPEVGVTYFAGTFVRHPLALAAAKASLLYMKEKGPALQQSISKKAERLANTLNSLFEQRRLPFYVAQYSSLWKIKYHDEIPYSELMFALMREKGVHIWDGFPCFTTEAHTEEEIDLVIDLFMESIDEMVAGGFFPSSTPAITNENSKNVTEISEPPVPGARLGKDANGNPAWFVSNPDLPGKYLQVEIN
ncbi:amino acid adenylation domain-containing protein [Dyadobacter sp. CY327]|uniref:polyketide synthase n=1 Tax=Dyadobacter sp. CY327 TaxID=2907301 RepID=UPI001F480A72|nr:polyketide synthase [Dyadobacter sp. CY327]MCE7071043.1 amino acid adenylation domain-containing protein [Dyadobacter sp. CY327]